MPISWWSQAHSLGLIAPNLSARFSRSVINDAGRVALVAADCNRRAELAAVARSLAVAGTAVAVLAEALAGNSAAALPFGR